METIHMEMKGEWKFASRDTGEQSVIAHGIIEMPKSYADNLGLDQQELFPMVVLTMVLEWVQCS
jgi:hypothetical protein